MLFWGTNWCYSQKHTEQVDEQALEPFNVEEGSSCSNHDAVRIRCL
jgi:hypothetical protein